MDSSTQPTPEPTTRRERREQRRAEQKAARTGMQQKNTAKRITLWVGALLLLAGIVALLIKSGGGTGSISASPEELATVQPNDWVQGDAAAPLRLIEYSDFQCPACAAYFPLIKQLKREMGAQLAVVYRHFPLAQHKHAQLAAQAAEAAGNQGKFWEMHDLLFDGQRSWEGVSDATEAFIGYAKQLSLDDARFAADLKAAETVKKVKDDRDTGFSLNVQGTPAFYLNGRKLTNPTNYDDFKQTLQKILDGQP